MEALLAVDSDEIKSIIAANPRVALVSKALYENPFTQQLRQLCAKIGWPGGLVQALDSKYWPILLAPADFYVFTVPTCGEYSIVIPGEIKAFAELFEESTVAMPGRGSARLEGPVSVAHYKLGSRLAPLYDVLNCVIPDYYMSYVAAASRVDPADRRQARAVDAAFGIAQLRH